MADRVTHSVHHHHHIHHHIQVPSLPGNQRMDQYGRRFMQPDNRTANYVGPGATYWQQFPVSPFFRASQGHQGTSYYGGYSRGYAYPSGGGYYGGFGYPTYGDAG